MKEINIFDDFEEFWKNRNSRDFGDCPSAEQFKNGPGTGSLFLDYSIFDQICQKEQMDKRVWRFIEKITMKAFKALVVILVVSLLIMLFVGLTFPLISGIYMEPFNWYVKNLAIPFLALSVFCLIAALLINIMHYRIIGSRAKLSKWQKHSLERLPGVPVSFRKVVKEIKEDFLEEKVKEGFSFSNSFWIYKHPHTGSWILEIELTGSREKPFRYYSSKSYLLKIEEGRWLF